MTNPTLITTPFAADGDKNAIPLANTDPENPQLASMTKGFPEITQRKVTEGGIPPERNDFNGILNLYGEHIVYLNKGLPYEFDQSFATAIGGYPLHARIMLSNGNIVKNEIPNNVANPNTDMTGWVLSNSASQIIDGSGETQQEVNDLQKLHNKSSATFTDYLTKNEINNSATTDLSAKLQAINDANEISTLRVTSGTYYINNVVTFNRDFAFDIDPDAVFKIGLNGQIKFEGSATLIGKPTTAISKKSKQWGLANTLQPLDLICIFNPVDYSFMPQRSYYKAGEFIKVFAADSTTITTAGKTWANYDTSVDVYKINPIKIKFNCLNILADNNALNNPVIFTFCEDLSLLGYNNIGSKNAGLTIDRCYNFNIPEPVATNNSPIVGLNYGVVIANSQNGRVSGGANIAGRHCVTFGGGNGVCSVPSREVIISNAVLKTGSTTGVGAGDFHGNVANCQYINCYIDHASVGGISNSFYNCTFWDRGIDGCAMLFGELGGGTWKITDCTLIVDNDLTSSRGALDCPFGNDLVEDFLLDISNLTIKGSQTANFYPIKFVVGSTVNLTKAVRCVINGLTCLLPNHASIIHADSANAGAGNIIPNFELSLSNVKTVKTGVAYLHVTATATSPLSKINLPSQSGSELILANGEANGLKAGAFISFPYFYPLPPSVTHSVGTDGTWVADSAFNLKPVGSILSTNDYNRIRLAIVSPSALPASKTFKVSWTASYNT